MKKITLPIAIYLIVVFGVFLGGYFIGYDKGHHDGVFHLAQEIAREIDGKSR